MQRLRGDQAVELGLRAVVGQEANHRVRCSEIVAELASRERRGGSAEFVPSDGSEFLTSTNLGERDLRIGTLVPEGPVVTGVDALRFEGVGV